MHTFRFFLANPTYLLQPTNRGPATNGPPQYPQNAMAMYPWSQRRLAFTSNAPPPFPRYGAAINSIASKDGDIYLMGGLVEGTTVKGDLWMVEAGSGSLACYPVNTAQESPGPRVGHASLLVGNAFIVFGGDTKLEENDSLDDTLYLLNTCKSSPRCSQLQDDTNLASYATLVQSFTSRPKTIRTIWSHNQPHPVEDLRLRWSG